MANTHDMGGQPAGRLDLAEHEQTLFDKRVDALYALLTGHRKAVLTMDEVRRTVESFSEADYLSMSYYERWLKAISLLMIEKGIATPGELSSPEDRA